jgi:hypothetical protein
MSFEIHVVFEDLGTVCDERQREADLEDRWAVGEAGKERVLCSSAPELPPNH